VNTSRPSQRKLNPKKAIKKSARLKSSPKKGFWGKQALVNVPFLNTGSKSTTITPPHSLQVEFLSVIHR
jgi:hypothetical protein